MFLKILFYTRYTKQYHQWLQPLVSYVFSRYTAVQSILFMISPEFTAN